MQRFFYIFGISLLFTHELDAMLRQEWALLYVLRELPSEPASWWFIYLHLPVFILALYLSGDDSGRLGQAFRLVVSAFMPIHAAIHYSLSDEANYFFTHTLSEICIYGAALCGFLYLVWWVRLRAAP